ncbi:hypothetical protein ARMGADRAFT_1098950 [Armillaria gallica]|uniref:Uncharacterized protein n=1 Tax=Armillaria gallica TaxID=47427 RepID=A0A2H3DS39_ARMGA|nr:hypothetical protein ARMGADRAFT_1098950 [Armillaria gallica]
MSSSPNLTKTFIIMHFPPSNSSRHIADRALTQSAAEVQYYKDRWPQQHLMFIKQNGQDDQHSVLYSIVNGAQHAVKRGLIVPDALKAPQGVVDIVNNPNAIDDRKGIFTTALAAITRLPPGDVQDRLNNKAIALLYNTLPNPPSMFIGPQYKQQSPDRFGNSVQNPQLGWVGMLYATQDQVHDKEKGHGLLYPNTFSEECLIFIPPMASALLVIFSRNHNYIANIILPPNPSNVPYKMKRSSRWHDMSSRFLPSQKP